MLQELFITQLHMMTEELKNFTKHVPNSITEMTQAHNTTQEQTDNFIENAISKAL